MPKKILLADDSITIQKVVELTFSDGDYQVIATNNGNRAIQKLAEVRPDIILSDIIMPEKNGYELCEYVKSHPDFRNIPVILLTGTFEPFDPDRAEKAGCDAVITKPFESQSLIHKVEELTRGAASATSPPASQPVEPPPPPAAPPPPPPAAPPQPFKTSPMAAVGQKTPPPPPSFSEKPEGRFGGSPPPAPPPPPSFEPPPVPEETEIDYSASTKAFPKMSFEELQRMSAGGEGAEAILQRWDKQTETSWTPPEEAAPASEWASPEDSESGFAARAGEGPSPFEEAPPTPPAPPAESLFESPAAEPSREPSWPTAPPVSPPETPARAAESASSPAPPEPAPAPSSPQPTGELTQEQIDQIARRVVELMSDQVIRNIAWEVIPDLAEMVVRERIRQLENES